MIKPGLNGYRLDWQNTIQLLLKPIIDGCMSNNSINTHQIWLSTK